MKQPIFTHGVFLGPRVPVARLAAAQAAIEEKRKAAAPKAKK